MVTTEADSAVRYAPQIPGLKLKMVTTGKLHRKLYEFHANKVGNVDGQKDRC